MKGFVVFALSVVLAAGALLYGLTLPRPIPAEALPALEGDPENGRLVFWAGGCASCHAAPGAKEEADKLRLGGGLALETDFGTFYAPNISPDLETGIGGWTRADFVNAMVRGVSPNGTHYYPAFPYTSYQRMTFEDLIDLKAFMDTLEPVSNRPPDHALPFPFNVRRGLGLWKRLYLDGAPFEPDQARDKKWNRGAYLVQGPSHCGECHTPRDRFGGLKYSHSLSGAHNPDGDGVIPNITPSDQGIGDWSEADIVYSLETGFLPDFDSFGGSMVSVQENMARLPAEDRDAIAHYLKSVPPLPDAVPKASKQQGN